jgi:hypothetical protein
LGGALMDNLTRTVTVCNREETLDYLKCIFGDSSELVNPKIRDGYLYVRLNNGSSFSMKIDEELPPTFKIEIRRKYTSLEPDFRAELYFNHNTAYIIKYMIKPKLEELWKNFKKEA